jgi:hypothetical protein
VLEAVVIVVDSFHDFPGAMQIKNWIMSCNITPISLMKVASRSSYPLSVKIET